MCMHSQYPSVAHTLICTSVLASVYGAIENAFALGMHTRCDKICHVSRDKKTASILMSEQNERGCIKGATTSQKPMQMRAAMC